MIGVVERAWRGLRRWFSWSEWTVRLSPHARHTRASEERGLVMIQIDGLSRAQLEKAVRRGRMPFLKRLIRREHYSLHPFYTGVPSTTPAIQAELFYGVKRAVPSFHFKDPQTGKSMRMYDPAAAQEMERRLEESGPALLAGGSAYVDIYSGGAAESHFCAVSFGWDRLRSRFRPPSMLLIALAHLRTLARTAALMAVETALALADFVRGVSAGEDLVKELKFVPTRPLICILLRDLVTLGVKLDIARGLPVIHCNFLGYDEQAHRRGPGSLFAHWALKGIDRSIRAIWLAAHRTRTRHYDVWIYSDHGQEHTVPYPSLAGKTIQEAVQEACEAAGIGDAGTGDRSAADPSGIGGRTELNSDRCGLQAQRAIMISKGPLRHVMRRLTNALLADADGDDRIVTAMGPVGHVYFRDPPDEEQLRKLARRLARDARVPAVCLAQADTRVRVFKADDEFDLDRDEAKLLGADHPYLADAARDLAAMVNHPAAGQLTLLGWRTGQPPVTFPVENGAHGGPGSEETNAFTLLPADIRIHRQPDGSVHTAALRDAALRWLGRAGSPAFLKNRESGERRLRVLTYNVHGCIGMDGKISPERIARIISRHEPDIVALQELDQNRPRSGGRDQAHVIAQMLEMLYHFHPSMHIEEGRYGNAVMSRFDLELVQAMRLPAPSGRPGIEPRGALWTAVRAGGETLHVINTHLGLYPDERELQARELLGPQWLGHPDMGERVIICGDFNAHPRSAAYKLLAERMRDAQTANGKRPRATWFGRMPLARIDHIFLGPGLAVSRTHVSRTHLDRAASDHLPLLADIILADDNSTPAVWGASSRR